MCFIHYVELKVIKKWFSIVNTSNTYIRCCFIIMGMGIETVVIFTTAYKI